MGVNQISGGLGRFLSALGGPVSWRLAKCRTVAQQINALEPTLQSETDSQLRKRSLSLRYRAKSGERLERLMVEGFALVREAATRTIGLRHFDVQLIGGTALFYGSIAEMETGEGKTLTATLPMYLHALPGKGAHLATVNDYLAARDAEWMRPVYQLLGLSVGVIQTPDSSDQRRTSYACDITYGTAKEFGFDFLRDRLLLRRMGLRQEDFLGSVAVHRFDSDGEQPVQRGMHFALVDEADSVLIDEARTPLIIGAVETGDGNEEIAATYRWAAEVADEFEEDEHYEVEEDTKKVELLAEGRQLVRRLPKPDILRTVGLVDLYQFVERAVKVNRDYHLDEQYVVRDGEVVIVDEFTGRLGEGRRWQAGIHEAIEAREGVGKSAGRGGQAARITIQDLFLRYAHLAGMTGTARSSAREMHHIYGTRVIQIPTNRPPQRKNWSDRIFGDSDSKWSAVVEDVRSLHEQGRPVLIGTRSIDKSEHLSELLKLRGLEHEVLNAREVAREADIVALAGQRGRITVATNMAGRGTDIKLGPGVSELGGLHVICTELQDAARIDRQLAGRCGRQGDPGSVRLYMALDDEIIRSGLGPERAEKIKEMGKTPGAPERSGRLLRKAQRKLERQHFRDRMMLMHHEKERKKVQREMGQDPYLDTPD